MTLQKIMIVDDSPLILEALSASLRAAGYEVSTRSVAIGTGAAILRERPALVLMDVSMPLLSGAEISESLRASTSSHDSVIVLYSDRPESELDTLSRQCGAAGFIRKSASQRELLAEITRFLALNRRASSSGTPHARASSVLVAGSRDTLTWARRVLAPLAVVRCTDSGTEALRLMSQRASAPSSVLLGTSLLDMRARVLWERATRMDERWKRHIVILDEVGETAPVGPPEMRRWAPGDPLAVLLEHLDLPRGP
jgi:DNA-binding response OmpR family regulator